MNTHQLWSRASPFSGPVVPAGESTRRRLLARGAYLAASILGGGSLAACGSSPAQSVSSASPGASTRPYTLTWGVRTAAAPDDVAALAREYQARNPHVTVDVFNAPGGIAASLEKLASGVAAGTPFDVITGHAYASTLQEGLSLLQPMDAIARKEKLDLGKYNQAFLNAAGRYKNTLYALPYAYGGNVAALAYNRDLFTSAGVPEPSADWKNPWTWDAFRDAMRRLTRTEGGRQTQVGAVDYGHWQTSIPMAWEARWIADDWKTAVCDSPEMIEAFTRYTDLLLKDRVFSVSPNADLGGGDSFLSGKAAVTTPCCAALTLAKKTSGTNLNWAFATMPKGKVASLDLAPTIMGMAGTGKNPTEAWRFLVFLDTGARLAAMESRLPAVFQDATTWIKENFAAWPKSNAAMLAEGTRVARPPDPIIPHPLGRKMADDVLVPGWKDVLTESTTATAWLREAKPRLQSILKDWHPSR